METKSTLTSRENEVAHAYADGLSHKEIADKLCIAPATVRTHVNSIYRKLGVKTKVELRKAISTEASGLSDSRQRISIDPRWIAALSSALIFGFAVFNITSDRPDAQAAIFDIPAVPSRTGLPSIAVQPFEIAGSDAKQQAFAAAIARDLVTDLSNFSTLLVFAADTTFAYAEQGVPIQEMAQELDTRYILSGDIRWQGDLVLVNAQLYSADSSAIVWAKRFEAQSEDLLPLQNEVVTSVVRIMGPADGALSTLRAAELTRIQRLPTESLTAYDHFLKGLVLFESYREEETKHSIDAFDTAVEIDPMYGRAHAYAGWAHLQHFRNNWGTDPQLSLSLADQRAQKAIEIDPHDPYGYWTLAAVRLYQRRHDLSISAYKQAIELNPNNAEMLVHLGWALTYAGEPDKGIEFIESAIEINPRYPGWYLWDYAFAHLMAGRYRAAADVLETRTPKTTGTHIILAMAYAMLDETERSEAALALVLQADPQQSISRAARSEPFLKDSDLNHYLEMMQKAGFPQ